MLKLDFNSIAAAITMSLVAWGSFQLYHLKADVAVIQWRVDENHSMLRPMWQEFLVRSASNGNGSNSDEQAGLHAAHEKGKK
jgi:hypothetical protein